MTGLEPYAGEDSDALVDARWVNLARQAQETLEQDILHLAALARRKTRSKNLCLAGGAALNCIINGKIIESGLFTGVYIQPAASDEGIPLGCALAGYYRRGGTERSEMTTAYLGRANAPAEATAAARRWGVAIRPTDTHELAALLANGKIIGRVAGRSEYGPRALGNRSILADPRPPGMKDRLNREIKHREGFRPFAPSCLEDKPPPFFISPRQSPFMVIAGTVHAADRDKVPAVTHADGSCRVQTVSVEQNAGYHDLIRSFGERTGCDLLVNTSFNDRDEPIVETYDDAISCFLRTGLDAIDLDGNLVERSAATPAPDPAAYRDKLAARINRRYTDLVDRFCDTRAYVELAERLVADENSAAPGATREAG